MSNEIVTPKELSLLKKISAGMDQPGSGWLHEIGDGSRSEAGVLGSLLKKELATSYEEDEGPCVCYCVEITEAGKDTLYDDILRNA